MEIIELYRVREWIKNLGIVLIGLISSGKSPLSFFLPLISASLLLSHSFSLNDLYDSKFGESNKMSKFSKKKGLKKAKLIIFFPLILSFFFSLINNPLTLIIAIIFSLLFFIYSAPPRLRNWWYFSIPINIICLGPLLFFLGFFPNENIFSFPSLGILINISIYLLLSEIIHQVSHKKRDKKMLVKSIIFKFKIKKIKIILLITCFCGVILNLILAFYNILFVIILILWSRKFKKILRTNEERIGNLRNQISFIPEGLIILMILFGKV